MLDARRGLGRLKAVFDAPGDLIDRLGARLGVRRVRQLVPNDTHIPEFAVIAVPTAEQPSPSGRGSVRRAGVRDYDAGQQSTRISHASKPKIVTPCMFEAGPNH